jgi:Leucine-rich repeat (LRR) protein
VHGGTTRARSSRARRSTRLPPFEPILSCARPCRVPVGPARRRRSITNNDALTALPALGANTQLHELYLFGNAKLATLPTLSGLTGLRKLNITQLPLLESVGTSLASNLEEVYFGDNAKLAVLPSLSTLSKLRKLTLIRLPLLSSVADRLPANLEELRAQDNVALVSIPDLSRCTDMETLHISGNHALTTVPPLI